MPGRGEAPLPNMLAGVIVLVVTVFLTKGVTMARKKKQPVENVECTRLRVTHIDLVDRDGRLCGRIGVSPFSGMPYVSIEDPRNGTGVSLSIGADGDVSVGVQRKDRVTIGMHDASSPAPHRSLFVLDDLGRQVFGAGIDMNGVRFIKLLGSDGKPIWEVSDKK